MLLEPILLGASLRAVLSDIFDALRAGIERDKLLVELAILLIALVLLVLDDVLQRTLLVLALTDVDELVTRRLDLAILLARFGLLSFNSLFLGLMHGGCLLGLRKLLVVRKFGLLFCQLVVVIQVAEPARVHHRCVIAASVG